LEALVDFKFVLALSVTSLDKRGSLKALATMSFVFRGSRGDIESGFSGFIPERPAVVCSLVCMYAFGYLYFAAEIRYLNMQYERFNLTKLSSSYQRIHAARPVNSNSLAFLVTGNFLTSLVYCYSILLIHIFNFTLVKIIFNPNLTCSFSSSFAVHDFKLSSDVTKLPGMPSLS
jgi:hypothetical protein